jgi:two-component system, OmpR family, response regulator ChvI
MQSRQENSNMTSWLESPTHRLKAVDDEADITFTLKKELEQSGFSLDVFNNPTIALSKFKPDYYDLIRVDVKMSKLNGFELYQEINKKEKNVKVTGIRYYADTHVTAYELFYESLKKEYPKLNVG